MSPILDAVPNLNPAMDQEHRIQVGLINALCNAVDTGKSADDISAILEQLLAYCDAHFMSEELLMRLASYDDFGAHVDEHTNMLDKLKEMLDCHGIGKSELIPGQARSCLAFLIDHINTCDRRYASWTRD